ncbi:MAG: beta-agarase [Planctomycetota bacterium]
MTLNDTRFLLATLIAFWPCLTPDDTAGESSGVESEIRCVQPGPFPNRFTPVDRQLHSHASRSLSNSPSHELDTGKEQKSRFIQLKNMAGRDWLVGPDGRPFFAHGITHVNNKRSPFNFSQFSTACRKLGFNAYGYGCPPILKKDLPYIEGWNHLVPISTYRGDGSFQFVDIFDPKVQEKLVLGVKASCQKGKHNPNLIGYCWTDLGAWPIQNSTKKNWVEHIKSLPDGSAGNKAYQNFLASWKGRASDKDGEFLRLIAREYFRVIGEANRKFDPDHLIFGDRFAFNTYDPIVVSEMLPWVDAIAIQPPFWGPFPRKRLDQIHDFTKKPILLCDFAIRFDDGKKDIRSFNKVKNSMSAGQEYTTYVKAAFDSGYILGVFWCNPVDSSKSFGKGGVKQGFFGDGLTKRPGLHEAVQKLNQSLRELTPRDQLK